MLKTLCFRLVVLISLITLNFNANSQQLKGDPWIFQVYKELYNRQPTAFELNINNYNLGSWGNYNELKSFVQQFQGSLAKEKITLAFTSFGKDKQTTVFVQNGKAIAANIMSTSGGNIIAAGGIPLVAAGGGNLVAAGGGNLVAAGGGNLVAAGGGNITISLPPNFKMADLAGVTFAPTSAKVLASAKTVKTSGKGMLVIKQ